jgi:hypothetical protein
MIGGLLIQASACIITTDDDDPDPTTGGILDVSWPVAACNAPTATVFSLNTDTQVMVMDTYSCSDGGTQLTANPIRLNLGNYSVWVEIQNDTMTRRHAISNPTAVSFVVDGYITTFVTDPIANEQGTFEVEWTIADGAGAPLTCAAAGASGGRFFATLAGTTVGDAFIGDCEEFYHLSNPLDQGLYTVVVELVDDSNPPLALNVNSEPFEETIIGNYTIHLGIFDFTVTP